MPFIVECRSALSFPLSLANYFSYSWHRFSQQENLPITHKDSKYVVARTRSGWEGTEHWLTHRKLIHCWPKPYVLTYSTNYAPEKAKHFLTIGHIGILEDHLLDTLKISLNVDLSSNHCFQCLFFLQIISWWFSFDKVGMPMTTFEEFLNNECRLRSLSKRMLWPLIEELCSWLCILSVFRRRSNSKYV